MMINKKMAFSVEISLVDCIPEKCYLQQYRAQTNIQFFGNI